MDTLKYFLNKSSLINPVELPNVGRDDLCLWLAELDMKIGVEVGVAAGEYSEMICRANPQMKLYGIDPWIPYKGYKDYTLESTFQKLYNKTLERMKPYPNYEIIKDFSMDAIKRFDDNSLDFVYIDGNHKEPYITQDITEWFKKVRPGGILSGHDYARTNGKIEGGWDHNWEVKPAVRRLASELGVNPWFVIGAEGKIPGTKRDNIRSWLYIK